ncbi:MAG: c-type cytochrome [Thermoleophilia bacterium]|nr:c-type cytochrome [Thermoleophilia bacterium]
MRAALAALAGLLLAGCGGTGGLAEAGSVSQGQQLFVENCGSCHVLAHAGTKGPVGPDLDAAFAEARRHGFEESTIREVVHKQILYPVEEPPTGEPGMPANLVEGADADSVAAYVACVAGRSEKEWNEAGCGPPAGQGGGTTAGGGGGGTADPKALFTSAGCAGCHVLAAAGATATVGPNLDDSDVSIQEAIAQIENGGGGMPAFRGKLQPNEIEALAKLIVESRGK